MPIHLGGHIVGLMRTISTRAKSNICNMMRGRCLRDETWRGQRKSQALTPARSSSLGSACDEQIAVDTHAQERDSWMISAGRASRRRGLPREISA